MDFLPTFFPGGAISLPWLEGRISSLHFNLGSGGPVGFFALEISLIQKHLFWKTSKVLGTKNFLEGRNYMGDVW